MNTEEIEMDARMHFGNMPPPIPTIRKQLTAQQKLERELHRQAAAVCGVMSIVIVAALAGWYAGGLHF